MILRDRDANTNWEDSADSALEERVYYCQNWRADVIALMTSGGVLVNQVRYDPYGKPFGIAKTDMDADGDVDAADYTVYSAYYTADTMPYADWDWDGTKDINDAIAYLSDRAADTGIGRGALGYAYSIAGGASRKGYAGYEIDPVLTGSEGWESIYHVRNRVYLSQLGRWTRRDPLGYVDGMSGYGFLLAKGDDNECQDAVDAFMETDAYVDLLAGMPNGWALLVKCCESDEEPCVADDEDNKVCGHTESDGANGIITICLCADGGTPVCLPPAETLIHEAVHVFQYLWDIRADETFCQQQGWGQKSDKCGICREIGPRVVSGECDGALHCCDQICRLKYGPPDDDYEDHCDYEDDGYSKCLSQCLDMYDTCSKHIPPGWKQKSGGAATSRKGLDCSGGQTRN